MLRHAALSRRPSIKAHASDHERSKSSGQDDEKGGWDRGLDGKSQRPLNLM